jgi:hypothetical protein
MKGLELFCGTKSFTTVAEARGHECRTLDNDQRFNPTYCMDIMDFEPSVLGDWKPDVIWASPPCEFFTLNAGGRYWLPGYVPKPDNIGPRLVMQTLKIIREIGCHYVIENPRMMLRKMPYMADLPRTTVCYCQYQDRIDRGPGKDDRPDMKPTDLWNNLGFEGRMCRNRNPDHRPAPRGKYYGDSYEARSVIPKRLCEEILTLCEMAVGRER